MTGVGATAAGAAIIGAGAALHPPVQPEETTVVPQLLQPVETTVVPQLLQAGAGALQLGAGAAQLLHAGAGALQRGAFGQRTRAGLQQ